MGNEIFQDQSGGPTNQLSDIAIVRPAYMVKKQQIKPCYYVKAFMSWL